MRKGEKSTVMAAAASVVLGYAIGSYRHEARPDGVTAGGAIHSFDREEYIEQQLSEARRDFLGDWGARYFQARSTGEDPAALIEELEESLAQSERSRLDYVARRYLFSSLEQNRLYGAWLNRYLTLLYTEPGHPLVRMLAGRASEIGRLTRREDEVRTGFLHRTSIPGQFAVRFEDPAWAAMRPDGARHVEDAANASECDLN